MASTKDDASTDIESVTKIFANDVSAVCAELRKARMDKAKKEAEKADKAAKAAKDK